LRHAQGTLNRAHCTTTARPTLEDSEELHGEKCRMNCVIVLLQPAGAVESRSISNK